MWTSSAPCSTFTWEMEGGDGDAREAHNWRREEREDVLREKIKAKGDPRLLILLPGPIRSSPSFFISLSLALLWISDDPFPPPLTLPWSWQLGPNSTLTTLPELTTVIILHYTHWSLKIIPTSLPVEVSGSVRLHPEGYGVPSKSQILTWKQLGRTGIFFSLLFFSGHVSGRLNFKQLMEESIRILAENNITGWCPAYNKDKFV